MAQVDLSTLPRSPKEAKALGSKLYFTGKPCGRGHIDAFSVRDGCETCRRERSRRNTAKHREKVQAPLRLNGLLRVCPVCEAEWFKPYGSTAKYCSDACRKTARRQKQRLAAAKPERREKKSAKARQRLQDRWQDPDFRAGEISRNVNYQRKRRLSDPAFAIRNNLSSRINLALKAANVSKSFSTLEITGCTTEYLKEWLEAQFQPGMTWENRSVWHIDHIRPCASFDLTDPEQQRECFHYTNLQPLWAEDNIKKGARFAA